MIAAVGRSGASPSSSDERSNDRARPPATLWGTRIPFATLPRIVPAMEAVLVRHGETEWSRAGRHTGRTDVPLNEHGREQAPAVGAPLRRRRFARVLVSPLSP